MKGGVDGQHCAPRRQIQPRRSRQPDAQGFDKGKTSDLGALRNQHGGYDHIPVDDPSYRAYVQQDVHLTRRLADLYQMTAYGQREHHLLAIAGELSLQGFRVDTAALDTQLREQAHRREELQRQLPITEPLATNKGRQQLARAFAEHGVALPRSAGGFPLVNRECQVPGLMEASNSR